MPISKAKLQYMLHLNQRDYTNREIACILNCNHRTVSENLAKYGFKSNWANQPINKISKTLAKCNKCNKVKNIKEFQHGRKGQKYEYRFSYCNECRKKQSYNNLNSDITKYLSDKYNRLKARAKKLKIRFNISKKNFINIYNKQNGRCFYTDISLVCKVGEGYNKNRFSIDRIIPEKGYIKSNIVFCTNKVNTVKSNLTLKELKLWIPKWYKKIKKRRI